MRDLVLLASLGMHLLGVHILMVKLIFGVELEGLIGSGSDADGFGEDAIEFEVQEGGVDGRGVQTRFRLDVVFVFAEVLLVGETHRWLFLSKIIIELAKLS